jgi:hypothetical protein
MAVTPNYSWPIPVATDLVKDGYAAIADLGDAIDATVFGLPSGGLSLISTTTIGTTVSSVTVSGAFSATYDNYKILVSGGVASTTVVLSIKLGATATGYYSSGRYVPYTGASNDLQQNNAVSWGNNGGAGTADGLFADIDLNSPFLAKRTRIRSSYYASLGASSLLGYLNNTTSYTDFTLTPSSGTLTGGTIRVYGYNN